MPADVMLVVLFAAFLHATWNVLVKSSPDKFLDVVLVCGGAGAISVVGLVILPFPAIESWPYLGASVIIHIVYFSLVAAAYGAGDMSYAYPIMRGTPPIIVAVASWPLLGEVLTPGAWAGVLLICGGVLGLTLTRKRVPGAVFGVTAFALLNATVIATYTFVDGVGVRLSGNSTSYAMWGFFLDAVPLLIWSATRHPLALGTHVAARWYVALIGGGCTLGSYTLVLWAMTHAPIAAVAALRETSIVIGTALSAIILKEAVGWTRHAAAAMVMLGVIALRLA